MWIRVVLLLLFWTVVCWAEVQPHSPIRCQRDRKAQLVSMDTAVTHFRHPTRGYLVDLIGVVHVGEKDYYMRLNKLFKNYDSVLYELIADGSAGRPIPTQGGEASDNPLSMVQSGLANMLGLDYQLSHIDYRPKNFVHADLSPDEFHASMSKNNESFAQVLLRSLKSGGVNSPEAEKELEKVNLFGAMLNGPSPQDRVHLRRGMALLFSKPEQMIEVLEGPGGGTLLAARNRKALSVLQQELGRGKKRIAIFYGAAHMLDMEQRLVREFGVQFQRQTWVPAWNLQTP